MGRSQERQPMLRMRSKSANQWKGILLVGNNPSSLSTSPHEFGSEHNYRFIMTAAKLVLGTLGTAFFRLQHLWADQGYAGALRQ